MLNRARSGLFLTRLAARRPGGRLQALLIDGLLALQTDTVLSIVVALERIENVIPQPLLDFAGEAAIAETLITRRFQVKLLHHEPEALKRLKVGSAWALQIWPPASPKSIDGTDLQTQALDQHEQLLTN